MGTTLRLHVARPLSGAHDWWHHGTRLRDELRAIVDIARVPSLMRDTCPQEVHAWGAARLKRDAVDCIEVARQWQTAVSRSVPDEATVWSEIFLSGSTKLYLDDLPGFNRPTTLAVPIEGWTVPDASRPSSLRLRWWSIHSELDHVSLSQAPGDAGTVVTVHERRGPLRGMDLETLALTALLVDIELPATLSSAALIDGTTGALLTRMSSCEAQGHPLQPASGLRLRLL
jgi:hypothetical protein